MSLSCRMTLITDRHARAERELLLIVLSYKFRDYNQRPQLFDDLQRH